MLRFPLRLIADLARARLAPGVRPVQFVDAAEILHHDSSHPVSHEKIREINLSRSPVVWIGGSEPLHHPGISHLVRAITQTGHFVFLETDGTLLRRRIHEFQPVPRLFLTVRLEPGARSSSSNMNRAGAFEFAAEGIRAARLSGFLISMHARVHAETDLADVAELVRLGQSLGVDGFVISPVGREANSANPDAVTLQQKTAESRRQISSQWWRYFSRLVEPILTVERAGAPEAEQSPGTQHEGESHANEEGIRVA